ncbi:MAG: hypothetical protein AAGB93_13680 [Planctomycetota bacterium]
MSDSSLVSLPDLGRARPRASVSALADRAAALASRTSLAALWVLSIGGAFLMWRSFSDFVFEDAFITYRYAENLAAGRGFVFTEGERVLGTTAPLYTLVLAAFGWIGLDIPATSGVIFALSIAAIAVLGGLILRRRGAYVTALIYACFAVSGGPEVQRFWGLETPFLTALLLGATYAGLQGHRVLAASLVAGAFLTRYDAAVFAVLYFGVLTLRDRRVPWREGLLSTLLVLPWLAFAARYFGSVLPNTLGAKTGDTSPLQYLTGMAERQWGLLSRFLEATGVRQGLGDAAAWVLLGALVLGVVAFTLCVARREAVHWLLLLYPVALFGAYAIIGPSLNFMWYPIPGVFLLVLAAMLGLAALARRAPLRWVAPIVLLPLVYFGAGALPAHFVRHAHDSSTASQYRFRVEAYERMSDWVLASGLQDQTYMTIEPGYFVYRSGNPAIDVAGLVTKGVYFHGDPSRRTSRKSIIEERQPGLILGTAGYVPDGYLTAHAGSTRFQLLMRRGTYAQRFDDIVIGHSAMPEAAPEMPSPFSLEASRNVRRRWVELGGIAGRVGRPYALRLDGEPYGGSYMFVPSGGYGAETPSFRIDFDRLEFLMAGRHHRKSAAQLVVDGAVVLSRPVSADQDPAEFERAVLDVTPWRGRVATLRFVQWAGPKYQLAFQDVRSANDVERRMLDDFECGHCADMWEETFAESPVSLRGPARVHGVGVMASSAAAHSFGLTGERQQASAPFAITHDELRFRMLDFGDPRVEVRLLVDDELVHVETGSHLGCARTVSWDVSQWRGRDAVLEIHDGAPAAGSWVGVDDLMLVTPR